ncbi:hypothetical protein [Streptomyces sp. NPDC001389]|uniref:hypothetical protein n=1 Tax=Streptomyces sp. NPDC001389 TaxID=3364569 RepID=UPI0036CE8B7A
MNEPLGAAAAIAALTEITGQPPETAEQDGLLTIRADPSHVTNEHWHRLIAVLETGTSYGMTTTAAGTRSVWLRTELGVPPRP